MVISWSHILYVPLLSRRQGILSPSPTRCWIWYLLTLKGNRHDLGGCTQVTWSLLQDRDTCFLVNILPCPPYREISSPFLPSVYQTPACPQWTKFNIKRARMMVSMAVLSSFNQSIAHKNSNTFPTKYSPFQLARTHLHQTLTGEQPVVILQGDPGLHRGPLILL